LNKWYFGNILLGGVIGMLVVDPLTGAMYSLDEDYVVKMSQDNSPANAKIESNL
jgi:hypothetical protein